MWLSVSLGCAAGGVYSDADEAARLTLSARQQYQAGRYLSAAALYQRALTIQESVLPANDPMIARLVPTWVSPIEPRGTSNLRRRSCNAPYRCTRRCVPRGA